MSHTSLNYDKKDMMLMVWYQRGGRYWFSSELGGALAGLGHWGLLGHSTS